ncbi:hypothetical protein IKQ26_06900 [bacterium]|nr:hypothetical protein [bacterium]
MISAISGFSHKIQIQNNNNINYHNIYNKYNLEKDTVSFSGKHQQAPSFSPRVQTALSVQSKLNKLYRADNLSFETIQEVLNSKSPVPIEVKPMSELPRLINAKNCQAYMQPKYEKDMKMSGATIYLKPDFSNKREATGIIADCIHEFTHILQRHEDGDYLGLTKYTSNLEEARFLGFISGNTMRDVEKSLQNTVYKNPEFLKIFEKKQKNLTPFTKNDLMPFMPSKEALKEDVDNLLNVHFENTMDIFKVPKQFKGEYLYFFFRAKPTLEQSILRQFEMESEAKTADIEARRTGLLPDFQSAFYNSLNKSLYDATIEVLK